MLLVEQVGGHETGTYVGKGNFQLPHVRQLGQGIEIGVLQPLRGRIGRGRTKPFRACNGRDNGNLPTAPLGKIVVCGRHHAGKAHDIGFHRAQLHGRVECGILRADTRDMAINIHAAHILDQLQHIRSRRLPSDIDTTCHHLRGRRLAKFFERLGSPAGNTYPPPFGNTQLGKLQAYTRSCPHDENAFHGIHDKQF